MQVVSYWVQLPGDWPWALSYLLGMLALALLPIWRRVYSGVYWPQALAAPVYTATVEPTLDTLGREACWVSLGYTVHCWACQHCCWRTLTITCYYRVAAGFRSYRAVVFGWLVSCSGAACRFGLVYYCRCVCPSGITCTIYPSLYLVPGAALVSWCVCYSQARRAYLPVMLSCVFTAPSCIGQPFGGVTPWSCGWLACCLAATKCFWHSTGHSEFTGYRGICDYLRWQVALCPCLILWFGGYMCFLGSGAIIPPAYLRPDLYLGVGSASSCCTWVLACYLTSWVWGPGVLYTWGSWGMLSLLQAPLSPLFGVACHPSRWRTPLLFIVGDALCVGWAFECPKDIVRFALPCLVAGIVKGCICFCTRLLGLPVAEGPYLCPCWVVVACGDPSWAVLSLVNGLHHWFTSQPGLQRHIYLCEQADQVGQACPHPCGGWGALRRCCSSFVFRLYGTYIWGATCCPSRSWPTIHVCFLVWAMAALR